MPWNFADSNSFASSTQWCTSLNWEDWSSGCCHNPGDWWPLPAAEFQYPDYSYRFSSTQEFYLHISTKAFRTRLFFSFLGAWGAEDSIPDMLQLLQLTTLSAWAMRLNLREEYPKGYPKGDEEGRRVKGHDVIHASRTAHLVSLPAVWRHSDDRTQSLAPDRGFIKLRDKFSRA